MTYSLSSDNSFNRFYENFQLHLIRTEKFDKYIKRRKIVLHYGSDVIYSVYLIVVQVRSFFFFKYFSKIFTICCFLLFKFCFYKLYRIQIH
jgi:hypothetical protein